MTKPQQPEIARSGKGEVTQEGRRQAGRERPSKSKDEGGKTGKVPPENEPGRKPEHEHDKPEPAR